MNSFENFFKSVDGRTPDVDIFAIRIEEKEAYECSIMYDDNGSEGLFFAHRITATSAPEAMQRMTYAHLLLYPDSCITFMRCGLASKEGE